jgi:Tfp pilus assembly major pilin PilA
MDKMRKEEGFPLIESIPALAIIGILVALILLSIHGVTERSQKSNAQNCIKKSSLPISWTAKTREICGLLVISKSFPDF